MQIVAGGVRFNLLLGEFDDQQLALRLRTAGRQWLSLEHSYLAPNFDGDSIWNVFASGAYRDLRGGYELGIGPEVKTYARGSCVSSRRRACAAGGSLGAVWRRGRGLVRGDSYWDDGYGGRSWASTCSRASPVHRKLELEGRLTGYHWRSDQPASATASNGGVVFGAQAGGRYRLGEGMRLHLLGEDNVSTYYVSQFRGLAVLELEASL